MTTNGPLLVDAEAMKRRLFDSVFGLGILLAALLALGVADRLG